MILSISFCDRHYCSLHCALLSNRYVGQVRGRGLLAGIELVAHRETKQPFHRSLGATFRSSLLQSAWPYSFFLVAPVPRGVQVERTAGCATSVFLALSAGVADKVTAAAFNRRMLCYPMGGNDVDGIVGDGYSDHVLIAPAYIATESVRSHIDTHARRHGYTAPCDCPLSRSACCGNGRFRRSMRSWRNSSSR